MDIVIEKNFMNSFENNFFQPKSKEEIEQLAHDVSERPHDQPNDSDKTEDVSEAVSESSLDQSITDTVFDDPREDPEVSRIEESIIVATNTDTRVQNNNRQTNGVNGYGDMWDSAYRRESRHHWRMFSNQYPEKARVYAEKGHVGLQRDQESREREAQEEKRNLQDAEKHQLPEVMATEPLVTLQEILPEHHKDYPESNASSENNQVNQELEKSPELLKNERVEMTDHAREVIALAETSGMRPDIFNLTPQGYFSEVITFSKQEIPEEKMVRIFRGVSLLDESIFDQVPYSMRSRSAGSRKPEIVEEVRGETEKLAYEPTYEHLISYAKKVRPHLSQKEVYDMDSDIIEIENDLLGGRSVRESLSRKQMSRAGGWVDSGIMPYISATLNPSQASRYAGVGMIVIDLPISQIEEVGAFRDGEDEVCIKGSLDKKYITAIMLRNLQADKGDENTDEALSVVSGAVPISLYDDFELNIIRESKYAEHKDMDRNQWEKDAESVGRKRIEELLRKFPAFESVTKKLQTVAKEKGLNKSMLLYTWLRRRIFDHYAARLENIKHFHYSLEEFDFEDGHSKKRFERKYASNIMLLKLRSIVERLEERAAERDIR